MLRRERINTFHPGFCPARRVFDAVCTIHPEQKRGKIKESVETQTLESAVPNVTCSGVRARKPLPPIKF